MNPLVPSDPGLLAAVIFAMERHSSQVRRHTGEPYILHPLRVGHRLALHNMPEVVLIAGVLHDVVEDCDVTFGELTSRFGKEVSSLVEQVTDVSKPSDGNRAARKELDLEHLATASEEGASIKLADIIDNVPSIVQYDLPFAAVYVPEKLAQLEVLRHGHSGLFRRAEEILAWATIEVGGTPLAGIKSVFYPQD
jgi:(p)ppGpp synthase/HD superfamily hydrolase